MIGLFPCATNALTGILNSGCLRHYGLEGKLGRKIKNIKSNRSTMISSDYEQCWDHILLTSVEFCLCFNIHWIPTLSCVFNAFWYESNPLKTMPEVGRRAGHHHTPYHHSLMMEEHFVQPNLHFTALKLGLTGDVHSQYFFLLYVNHTAEASSHHMTFKIFCRLLVGPCRLLSCRHS